MVEAARTQIEKWLQRLEKKRGLSSHPLYAQEFVRILTDNRKVLSNEYRERKYSARNVDVLGMALSEVLNELATDEEHILLNRVIFDNAQVRLMFVTPTSEYVKQRAIEDGDSLEQLQALLRESVRQATRIYARFKILHEKEEKRRNIKPSSVGSLVIKVTDFCPHFTVYRTDDSLLWGIYTSATLGLHSAVLQVNKSHDALFHQMVDHFNSLWNIRRLDGRPDDRYLVKCHSHIPPMLNEALVDELLGVSWREESTGAQPNDGRKRERKLPRPRAKPASPQS